jgi:hypothetical protein
MWKCDDENGMDEQIMENVKRVKMARKGKKWSG